MDTLNHQSLLRIENLRVSHKAVEVLDVPSLGLGRGAVGLLGVNGAGKTTLLSALAGIHKPRSGRVLVDGFDPYRPAERRRALQRVALVPQEFDFPRYMRLSDFLVYMAELRDVPRTRRREVSMECAERVDLAPQWGARLSELSGGMLRRASIAQALVGDAKVVLCDESTAGLDPQQRMEIRKLIIELSADRCVLFASHIVEDLAMVAGRVLVLSQGKVVFDGSRADLEAKAPQGEAGAALERAFLAIVGHRA